MDPRPSCTSKPRQLEIGIWKTNKIKNFNMRCNNNKLFTNLSTSIPSKRPMNRPINKEVWPHSKQFYVRIRRRFLLHACLIIVPIEVPIDKVEKSIVIENLAQPTIKNCEKMYISEQGWSQEQKDRVQVLPTKVVLLSFDQDARVCSLQDNLERSLELLKRWSIYTYHS